MTDIQNIPELVTIDQLSGRLGITVRHVRRLVYERRIPYVKVGRLVRFDVGEIVRWVDSHREARQGTGISSGTNVDRRLTRRSGVVSIRAGSDDWL